MSDVHEHPLSTEAAAATIDVWNRLIRPKLKKYKKSPARLLDSLIDNGLTVPLYNGESYRNGELLALGELFVAHHLVAPKQLIDAIESALSDELYEDILKEWKFPDKRRQYLLSLATRLSLEPTPRMPVRRDLVPCACADELLMRIESWYDDQEAWADDYPRFCEVLDSLMESRLGYDYDESYDDATRQRFMLMAFYVVKRLRYPREFVIQFIERAHKFIWPGLAGASWKDVSR